MTPKSFPFVIVCPILCVATLSGGKVIKQQFQDSSKAEETKQQIEELKKDIEALQAQVGYLKHYFEEGTPFADIEQNFIPKVHFYEDFESQNWTDRWAYGFTDGAVERKVVAVESLNKSNHGLQTIPEIRITGKKYNIYAMLDEPLSMDDEQLIVQFMLQYGDTEECNGGFLSLYKCEEDAKLQSSTQFPVLQFGPDIHCNGTKSIIFRLKEDGQHHDFSFYYDRWEAGSPHIFTLVLKATPSREFYILHNGTVIREGTIINLSKNDGFLCYSWTSVCRVGIDVFQKYGGSIFDDILISSDLEEAKDKRFVLYQSLCDQKRHIHSHKIFVPNEEL